MNLFLCGRKCFHATSQKRALLHVISFAGNYRLFAHIDVSYRFNGESDNVVLEFAIATIIPPLIQLRDVVQDVIAERYVPYLSNLHV